MDNEKRDLKIIIVGAGIAGLAAAKTLEEANFKNYIILEAQSQIGGRINSLSWNEAWIETGAQFLHGSGSALGQIAQKKQLLSDITAGEGEGIYLREDGSSMNCKLVREIDDFVKDVLEECEHFAETNEIEFIDSEINNVSSILKKSFHEYLVSKNDSSVIIDAKNELFDWNIRFLVIDNGCKSLEDLSLKSWGKFKAVSGSQHNIFKKNYSMLLDAIAAQIPSTKIRLNSAVIKIEWKKKITDKQEKPVTITLFNSEKFTADCVIVTSSLGFLKDNYNHLFVPQLPKQYISAIENIGFGTINKIFLNYNNPWWEPSAKGIQFLWSTNKDYNNTTIARKNIALWTRDLTGFDIVRGQKATLLGWVGGKGAKIIETLTEEQILKDCTELFRYFYKSESIPEANKCFRTSWNSNVFIKGAYSHITTKCDIHGVSPATLAEPILAENCLKGTKGPPILMLAGEATHENYYSTTHGAYDTGVKQAKIFLSNLHFY